MEMVHRYCSTKETAATDSSFELVDSMHLEDVCCPSGGEETDPTVCPVAVDDTNVVAEKELQYGTMCERDHMEMVHHSRAFEKGISANAPVEPVGSRRVANVCCSCKNAKRHAARGLFAVGVS